MKLQYLGAVRRDGSWPKVALDDGFEPIVDGFIEVPASEVDRLVETGNFKLAVANQATAGASPDKEALIVEAKALGIPANKSWSVNAIRKAIDKAKGE